MFVQGFGEILTDIMTVNPALSEIPSTSAILDASNYTFQAVTFGKDAGGYVQHSHAVSSTQHVSGDTSLAVSSFDSGILNIINYGSDVASGASSYVFSATYSKFISNYDSMPNDPSPLDTRLERGSTLSTNLSGYQYASALPDLGHYPNAALDPQLSAIWNKVGAFAPSGDYDDYEFRFHDKNLSGIFSFYVSSFFNRQQIMDKDGYLTMTASSVTDWDLAGGVSFENGSIVASSTIFDPAEGLLTVQTSLRPGDNLSLAAFGGVKHFGIYCFDLKSMLASGLMPPYTWNALNNNRKYKLVAKATTLYDPLFHRDVGTSSGLLDGLNVNNVLITKTFDFK
tara:strand:- start:7250 stop:8269 length:1020 start_codon:yes stop_codon:yes gene_type:complete